MIEQPAPRVHAYQASTEVASGPPPINWKELDNFDPSWLVALGIVFGGCFLLRIFLSLFGFYWTCVFGWLAATIASYGVAGFMLNPLYCVLMSVAAGTITWIVLIILSEAFNAPGRIWWKITR